MIVRMKKSLYSSNPKDDERGGELGCPWSIGKNELIIEDIFVDNMGRKMTKVRYVNDEEKSFYLLYNELEQV